MEDEPTLWAAEGLFQGDCREVLRTLEANSVDACVTDPPYGIGFMGKQWDTFTPGREQARVHDGEVDSLNPNVKGRQRSPATSPASVEYNRSLEGQRVFQDWTASWAAEVLRVLKPGGHLVVFGAPRSGHRMACGIEDAGFEVRDTLMWLFGQGFPKSKQVGGGGGTALKPAWEPIVLARKPCEGTVTGNVERWGVGGVNVEGCRRATTENLNGGAYAKEGTERHDGAENWRYKREGGAGEFVQPQGRWPANLLLDEEAAARLDGEVGELKSGTAVGGLHRRSPKTANCYGLWQGEQNEGDVTYGDSGGPSRFFYCAKTSRAERNFGCADLAQATAGEMTGGRKEGSAGLANPRAGAGRTSGGGNSHPTVKPLALMRWLCRLVTPKDGVVLDPFVGSGSTGIAVEQEGLGGFLGIDQEAQWLRIAAARMQAWRELGVQDAE